MTLFGRAPHHDRVFAIVLVVGEHSSPLTLRTVCLEPNSPEWDAFWQDIGRPQEGPERTSEAPATDECVQPACPTPRFCGKRQFERCDGVCDATGTAPDPTKLDAFERLLTGVDMWCPRHWRHWAVGPCRCDPATFEVALLARLREVYGPKPTGFPCKACGYPEARWERGTTNLRCDHCGERQDAVDRGAKYTVGDLREAERRLADVLNGGSDWLVRQHNMVPFLKPRSVDRADLLERLSPLDHPYPEET